MTLNQLTRRFKTRKRSTTLTAEGPLGGCPQVRAIVLKVLTMKPKKPNSALRKVLKVLIQKTKKVIYAYLPGENPGKGRQINIRIHNQVMVIGAAVPDLNGVSHKVIRGALDVPKIPRTTSRSKYCVRKPVDV